MLIKQYIKKLIHKSSFKLLDEILKEKKLIKTFPRYKLNKPKTIDNSVVGWVPYLKQYTKILVFNFFSFNYSIRKPLKGKIYLVNKDQIKDLYEFTLHEEQLMEFNPDEIFNNTEGEILIVELTSQFINKNHGGHDGHLRFWGKYIDNKKNTRAISHSMPLSYNNLFSNISNEFSRDYSLKLNKEEKILNFYPGGCLHKKDTDKHAVYGFNMIIDKQEPKSVWHLSPKNKNSIQCKLTQGFYCPKSDKIDPFIILDPNETGIKNNEIHLFIVVNNQITLKKQILTEGLFKEKVSSMFPKINTDYYFFIKFKSLGKSHAHVHFSDKNNAFDQVHMHDCNWEFKDKHLTYKQLRKNKNCRKFFCYDLENSDLENYIVIHNEKIENKPSNNLKVRLFQNEKENLLNLNLQPNQPIEVINVKEIFENATHKNSLIQIESTDYNFHASGLILNRSLGNIYTDHFTGG